MSAETGTSTRYHPEDKSCITTLLASGESEVKTNMGKTPLKYVSYGICPKCGQPIIRNFEINIGVCTCQSAVEVALKPTILFRTNSRLYRKLEKIAKVIGVSVEDLVTKIYELALDDKEFIEDFLKQVRARGGSKT